MRIHSSHQWLVAAATLLPLCETSVAQSRDPADWFPSPEALRQVSDYFPHEIVARGSDVYELEWGEKIDGVGGLDLESYNRENGSTGMIVLHRGRIVYEGYWHGASSESHFTSWSMVKSITGTLIGIAEAEGLIESIEDPIIRYVPALADTAYRDVTIEQALQMSSGVSYSELQSELQLSCLAMPPGPVVADCDAVRERFGDVEGFLLALDNEAAPPGTTFQYSTAESQVLGWVLQEATGQSPAQYLSAKLWQPLGMEADAMWLLDPPSGMLLTGMSINARLRDYARFGLLMLNEGVRDGKRILPRGWVERATTPGKPYLRRLDPQIYGYGYQWWLVPDGVVVPNGTGAFEAQGALGQFLHVDPEHELVVAMTSFWPGIPGWDVDKVMAFHATLGAIIRALGYE